MTIFELKEAERRLRVANENYMVAQEERERAIRNVEEVELSFAYETMPAGFTMGTAKSDYYGSHYEYGHGPINIIYAYSGEEKPVVDFYHGTYNNNWKDEISRFSGIYWNGEEWQTVDQMEVD